MLLVEEHSCQVLNYDSKIAESDEQFEACKISVKPIEEIASGSKVDSSSLTIKHFLWTLLRPLPVLAGIL